MRFGLFGGTQATSEGFRNFVEFTTEAESLGYYSSFVVEHHFTGWNQISATLQLLTWVAARTRTLRIGTAVMVLPWHNPVLLAEQAATLDLLSEGRLDFGVGKGYRYTEFTGFCVPREEAEARFEEAFDVMLQAWSGKRFSHRGKYWQFENVVVEPSPVQKPHPPIWMGGGSPASIRRVAELGCNLLLDQFATPETLGERIALFKGEVEARGRTFDPMTVAVARDVYVAKDEADTRAALDRNARARQRILEVSQFPGRKGGSHMLAYDHSVAVHEAVAIYGKPDEVMEKLEALQAVGVRYVLANIGGDSRESLRRLARDIVPAFPSSDEDRRKVAQRQA